jgi:NhaP-type Na+/H+ or K+/H+ antiporter
MEAKGTMPPTSRRHGVHDSEFGAQVESPGTSPTNDDDRNSTTGATAPSIQTELAAATSFGHNEPFFEVTTPHDAPAPGTPASSTGSVAVGPEEAVTRRKNSLLRRRELGGGRSPAQRRSRPPSELGGQTPAAARDFFAGFGDGEEEDEQPLPGRGGDDEGNAEGDDDDDDFDGAPSEGEEEVPVRMTVHERIRLERQRALQQAMDEEEDEEELEMQNRFIRNASFVSNMSMISTSSLLNYPPEVVHLVRQMRNLGESNLLVLEDLTRRKAQRGAAYSMLEYRGSSWFLPSIRPSDTEGGEPNWGVAYDGRHGLILYFGGQRMELHLVAMLLRMVLVVLAWFVLWAMLPNNLVELRGYVFDPLLVVLVSAVAGGILSRFLQFPPLICVLAVAILLNNVPSVGYFTSGIHPKVRKSIISLGLTTILLKAGLSIKVEELKPIMANYVALSMLPAIAELVVHSFVAQSLFGYDDTTWAFMQGAVVAGCSPSVMVPALLSLKVDGYCVKGGPGLLMLPASPTEMVAAIWNINFTADLIFNTDVSLALSIALGPIQIVGGALLGLLLAGLHYGMFRQLKYEAKKLPHRRYARDHSVDVSRLSAFVLVMFGSGVIFYTKTVSLAGGGSVAVTVMAVATAYVFRRESARDPFVEEHLMLVGELVAQLWDLFVMPALFAMVGSSIVVADIFTAEFLPKAVACLFAGLAARFVVAALCTVGQDYSKGERFLLAFGWMAKASVQAALGPLALQLAEDNFGAVSAVNPALAKKQLLYGRQIADMAVLTIIISAPLAAITLVRAGPHLFRRDGEPEPPTARQSLQSQHQQQSQPPVSP